MVPPRVVVIGDSFTVGTGSSSGRGFTEELADVMTWSLTTEAQGGTGYLSAGRELGQSVFQGRLSRVVDADPDVVVIQGSTNDVGAGSAEELAAAARRLYSTLTAKLPDARVVAVGPVAAPAVDRAGLEVVRDALAAASADEGIWFIDPVAGGWLMSPGLFADGLHPNDEGYRVFAYDLALSLRQIGL